MLINEFNLSFNQPGEKYGNYAINNSFGILSENLIFILNVTNDSILIVNLENSKIVQESKLNFSLGSADLTIIQNRFELNEFLIFDEENFVIYFLSF